MIPLALFPGHLALNSTEAEMPDGPGLARIPGTIKMQIIKQAMKRWIIFHYARIP